MTQSVESEALNLSLNHENSSHRASVIREKKIFAHPTEQVLSSTAADQDKSELSLV